MPRTVPRSLSPASASVRWRRAAYLPALPADARAASGTVSGMPFIVIDGPDGTGKTTVAEVLVRRPSASAAAAEQREIDSSYPFTGVTSHP